MSDGTTATGRRAFIRRRFATPEAAAVTIIAIGVLYRLSWFLVSTVPINPGADSDRYILYAYEPYGLFSDVAAPAGYSIFLKIIGLLPQRAVAILVVQHAIGLLTAWGVWVLGRRVADRIGLSRWWALPAVAFATFDGDITYFSQVAMTETISFASFIACLIVAERLTVGSGRSLTKLVLLATSFGALAALSQTIRTANGPLMAMVLVLCLFWVATWPRKIITVIVAAGGAGIVLGVYLFGVSHSSNKFSGLGGIQGWMLYGRTSSFADCRKSPPLPGQEKLCDRTPRAERLGPFAYAYALPALGRKRWSPAIKAYAGIPNNNADLQKYSINVIKHQPLDYIAAVIHDMDRYVAPDAGHNPGYSTPGPEFEEIGALPHKRPGTETFKFLHVKGYYPGPLAAPAEAWLAISRFPPFLMVLFTFLPLLVLPLVRKREVWATIVPLWLVAVASASLPVVLVSYEYRYGLPTQLIYALIGPLGIGLLVSRWRSRPADGAAAPADSDPAPGEPEATA